MNDLEKEEFIFQLGKRAEIGKIQDKDILILEQLSLDKDPYVRSCVAEALVYVGEKGESILLRLMNDKDSLVRTEACDSLCFSHSENTYHMLKKKLKSERNGIVRGYIVLSLTDIADKIGKQKELVLFFQELEKKESVEFVKISYFSALYQLGEKSYLQKLIGMLSARTYQNRCAVINSFSDIVNPENVSEILNALSERKKMEKSEAVVSTINEFLRSI